MKTYFTVAFSMLAGAAMGAAAVQGLHAQAKPVYQVSMIDVANGNAYAKEFVPKILAALKAHGGQVIGASQKVTQLEGNAPTSRVSISKWPSLEDLQSYMQAPDFKEARQIGDKYAKFSSYAVQSVP
jgi:uncharacterized protein (DUF1330 family)